MIKKIFLSQNIYLLIFEVYFFVWYHHIQRNWWDSTIFLIDFTHLLLAVVYFIPSMLLIHNQNVHA